MYLIREIYNPTSYIDERGEENPNELYRTSRPKHLPKVPGEQVNWDRGRCDQPNPDCGNLYRSNNLEARGGGEQKGNLNNLCQPSVPYLILLPTKEGKRQLWALASYWWHWRKYLCRRIIMFMLNTFSGEGNGNPLQYSCLENPMGGGAL